MGKLLLLSRRHLPERQTNLLYLKRFDGGAGMKPARFIST
jgi:hypothetical protein